MKKYSILQYWNTCSEEDIVASGGWDESKYTVVMNEDEGDICETFETEDEAYKSWFRYYSGTEFEYVEHADEPQWGCYFYVLCEFDEDTKELNILEESCGNLTIEDISHRE